MRRRDAIAGIVSTAAMWPLAVRAQQQSPPVIGYLGPGTLETRQKHLAAYLKGLAETGFFEGKNVTIEYRWVEGHNERLAETAAELVSRHVAVISIPGNTASILAAKAATSTIPIVFLHGNPVEMGLVTSLAHPGGNLTGVNIQDVTLIGKRLEVLHELVPAGRLIAYLYNPTNPAFSKDEARDLKDAASRLGVTLLPLGASGQSDVDGSFAMLKEHRADALFVGADVLFLTQREQLVALAARYALPTIYAYREIVEGGGLVSYGTDNFEAYRKVGVYTGRILKGEKPADLPVEQSSKVELAINLKTAAKLGIAVPTALTARADQVIE